MKKDRPVSRARSNVFAGLGLPDPDEHLLKAQIVLAIGNVIRQRDLTQEAAARIMGLRQPDVSKLLKGRFEGFSLERLISFVLALGHPIRITVDAANKNYAPAALSLELCD